MADRKSPSRLDAAKSASPLRFKAFAPTKVQPMGGQTAPLIPTGVVLSDIDDTFISSGGGTHGQDQRFEHGEIYPGAPEMYLGLALGPDDAMPRLRRDTGAARAAELCSQGVTWLSARAANTAIVKWFAGAIKPDDRISMALSNIGKKTVSVSELLADFTANSRTTFL